MFNLVKRRYLFLIISLIIIVPGTISLLIFHLNVGIDFAGGATVEFRPSQPVTANQMRSILKPLNLAELQVLTGSNDSLPGNQTIWVRLNTRVDGHVQDTIKNTLQTKYGKQLSVIFDDLSLNPAATVVTITKFQGTPPSTTEITSVLGTLPMTSDVNKPAGTTNVTPTPVPTATPTTAVTPTATAKAKATASATPKAKASATATAKSTPTVVPTATATPIVSNPANIAVNVTDAQAGTTTLTIQLLTRSVVDTPGLIKLESTIYNANGTYVELLDNASVSPSIAGETTQRAVLAVFAASVCILLYIWFAFRKVAKPWRYGACAIIALLHDVLVVLGVFSILGWLIGLQIDALFITALLTVVGFSVHDTIVVFDRIRENMQRRTSETFEQVVNASLVQTMARSLNTSLTVLFTLSALTLFGGTTIRSFTLALLVGIFSGTYSSIFNASMLLVIWEKGELGMDRFSRDRTPSGRESRERELARARG